MIFSSCRLKSFGCTHAFQLWHHGKFPQIYWDPLQTVSELSRDHQKPNVLESFGFLWTFLLPPKKKPPPQWPWLQGGWHGWRLEGGEVVNFFDVGGMTWAHQSWLLKIALLHPPGHPKVVGRDWKVQMRGSMERWNAWRKVGVSVECPWNLIDSFLVHSGCSGWFIFADGSAHWSYKPFRFWKYLLVFNLVRRQHCILLCLSLFIWYRWFISEWYTKNFSQQKFPHFFGVVSKSLCCLGCSGVSCFDIPDPGPWNEAAPGMLGRIIP